MKKILALISTAVLAGMTPVDEVHPVLEFREAPIASTQMACPYYIPSTSNVSENLNEDGVTIYVHCPKCQQGVMSEHVDGDVKCTFCGEKN
jgi:DNA-directed RNA polymerase subunit RPC12/RpoP